MYNFFYIKSRKDYWLTLYPMSEDESLTIYKRKAARFCLFREN